MSHRRSAPSPTKGKGSHLQQQVPTVRPTGQVKPVVSSRRHGKPVEREVSDAGGTVFIAVILILSVGAFVAFIIHLLT